MFNLIADIRISLFYILILFCGFSLTSQVLSVLYSVNHYSYITPYIFKENCVENSFIKIIE